MRAPILSIVLLLAVTAIVPIVPVACLFKTLSLDEYGLPKKVKEENSYVQDALAKTSTAYNVGEAEKGDAVIEKPDEFEVSPVVPNEKVKKEKSSESGEPAYLKKEKKEKPDGYDKKEKKEKTDEIVSKGKKDKSEGSGEKKKEDKSENLDEYASPKKEKKEKSNDSSNKKEKKKSDDLDELTSHKKQKEKSDGSDESSSSKKKKKKKEKSIESDESASPKKEKKVKSDDSDESSSSSKKKKKEKKEKSVEADASAYFKKEKKEEKKKSKDLENEEKPDEDATPVDVSTAGEYVSPKDKSDDDAMPVDVSAAGQYLSSTKVPATAGAYAAPKQQVVAKAATTAGAYAAPKQQQVASRQPMGGAPDELPPAAKSSTSAAAAGAYTAPKQQQIDSSQPMGGAPDELPPAATKSSQPMSGAGASPDELPPAAAKTTTTTPSAAAGGAYYASPRTAAANPNNKPKLSMESFSGMIKRPIAKMLSPVIKSACAKTEYPADCEASIAGLPGAAAAQATDTLGVLKLAMEAVRQKAIVAMNAATDRMNAPGTDATTKEALDSCTSSYSDIKTSLDTVDAALKRGDVDTAHTNLDSVETDVTTCDDGFQERGTPSVMTDHDQELQKLASNLLSIGAVLHH